MNAPALRLLFYILTVLCIAGCANIVPPSGGGKDVVPPKLVKVTPLDSGLNVRTAKVRFDFDEYITLNDAVSQVIISPLLPINPVVTALGRHVTFSVPDSLLQENTTYRITLGNAVRDLNENNIFQSRGYIFSTGSYFDSLSLSGNVTNAMTGFADTSTTVLLYNATENDSAVVKKRPLYAAHVNAAGIFSFQGLPARSFRIYALRDKNANLIFDDHSEWIAFNDRPVFPGQDSIKKIALRSFPVAGIDTIKSAAVASGEPSAQVKDGSGGSRANANSLGYVVAVDTGDIKRRSQEITKPLTIAFMQKLSAIDPGKFFLTYDSSSITVEAVFKAGEDSMQHNILLTTKWVENAVYTLRLQKGFAKDSAGHDYLPGRYTFRTKRDDDYAKLSIHLPAKYFGDTYVLQVTNETDTVYKKAVLDSNVALIRIPPGNYKLLVIEDRNRNGHWDTGDLFGKKQPEKVIPFERTIMLKPGWENQQDFEPEVKVSPAKFPQKTTPVVPR